MGQSVEIQGREYKLLLDAGGFKGEPSDPLAQRFWSDQLKPIIDEALDSKEDDESRAEGELKFKKSRVVTFHDTREKLLNASGFALRKRTGVVNGALKGLPEITLKFRTPDALLADAYGETAKPVNPQTTLEEDIAPLQAAQKGKPPVVADPPSTYSRFSVSSEFHANSNFANVGDVFGTFPMLRDRLERVAGHGVATVPLVSGPTICEWVFQHAHVQLGKSLQAEFALSLWYFLSGPFDPHEWKGVQQGDVAPRIAEISFDFKIEDEPVTPAAAARALNLFTSMQQALPVDTEETSKTALALP